jgi:hypothetical protein
MKHLSRVLSLALVIALSLGLVVTAGAIDEYKKFTDVADVEDDYLEAVDVLTALKVFEGYEDGTFQPKREVRRAEAAKLVAYISIGATAAERLISGPSHFTDVEDGYSWANKYIEYAYEKGIINGVGGGRFNPGGYVTGAQFAKLMLTALGYGAKDEYIGSSWELHAIVDGQTRGILTVDTDYSQPATREQVAQYVFNTIAPGPRNFLVKISTLINDYVYINDSGSVLGTTGSARYLGQETFNLVKDSEQINNLGYSAHKWKIGPNDITGIYRDGVVLYTSTDGTPVVGMTGLTTLGSFNYKASLGPDVTYWVNGTQRLLATTDAFVYGDTTTAPNTYAENAIEYRSWVAYSAATVASTTNEKHTQVSFNTALEATRAANYAADIVDITTNVPIGVIVDLVDNDGDNKADKVIITKKRVALLSASVTTNAATGNVFIPGVTTAAQPPFLLDYPSDLGKGDVVLYYTDNLFVTHVERAESIQGQLTRYYNNTKILNFGGQQYTISGLEGRFDEDDFTISTNGNYNVDATAYFDDNGSVVYVVVTESGPPNYVVVLGSAGGDVYSYTIQAQVVQTDGAVKIVNVSKLNGDPVTASGGANGLTDGAIYKYSVDASGYYVLDTPPGGNVTSQTITNVAAFSSGHIGNDATIFIIGQGNNTYKAYTGVRNVPAQNALNFVVARGTDGIVDVVYVPTANPVITAPTANFVFFINPADEYAYHPETTLENEYTVRAIINGEVKEVELTAAAYGRLVETNPNGALYTPDVSGNLLQSVIYDADGVITGFSTLAAVNATVYTSVSGTGTLPGVTGTINFGGGHVFSYSANTKVFYITYGTPRVVGSAVINGPLTVDAIGVDANDFWVAQQSITPNQYALDALYIITDGSANTAGNAAAVSAVAAALDAATTLSGAGTITSGSNAASLAALQNAIDTIVTAQTAINNLAITDPSKSLYQTALSVAIADVPSADIAVAKKAADDLAVILLANDVDVTGNVATDTQAKAKSAILGVIKYGTITDIPDNFVWNDSAGSQNKVVVTLNEAFAGTDDIEITFDEVPDGN